MSKTRPDESVNCYGEFADGSGNHLGYLSGGLTKREYFAAMAMQGFLAAEKYENYFKDEVDRASAAVDQADALIAALNSSND